MQVIRQRSMYTARLPGADGAPGGASSLIRCLPAGSQPSVRDRRRSSALEPNNGADMCRMRFRWRDSAMQGNQQPRDHRPAAFGAHSCGSSRGPTAGTAYTVPDPLN